MISEIDITGFRCFDHLHVRELTRVNLVVGRNNSGKTSLLEAVEFIQLGTRALARGPVRRKEELLPDTPARGGDVPEIDVSHLFFGHRLGQGSRFTVENVGGELNFDCRLVNADDPDALPGDVTLVIEALRAFTFPAVPGEPVERIRLSPFGGLPETWRRAASGADAEGALQFLGPGTPDIPGLARLWDAVTLTAEEGRVYEALRIVEPDLERVAFIGVGGKSGVNALAKLSGREQRLPLGSLGEGMRRLLALALHLVASRDGVLLVDEIDTGLHHTVMTKMWELVIRTARRLDVQVFATTHSLDCVEALANVTDRHPELAEDVSLHRIDPGEEQTMRYAPKDLIVATRGHIEVR